jgi:hypothetical protein
VSELPLSADEPADLVGRLRLVVEAKDAEVGVLRERVQGAGTPLEAAIRAVVTITGGSLPVGPT